MILAYFQFESKYQPESWKQTGPAGDNSRRNKGVSVAEEPAQQMTNELPFLVNPYAKPLKKQEKARELHIPLQIWTLICWMGIKKGGY
ncbi:hypothetical protein [Methanoregula formicica]|uniref:Uncharacterized protein n=1 Tax=Methanoregula formicica (strain DSM 22288 / NBRC 105244 / SMSP) TaxID=593750 RepID=L0HBT1_METFS|nr:hypothetical protein [Methanoregula formicica]AGB01261.1 hypothetical protein Metfor_0179 [Methanoregula formicica SMSP]